MRQRLGGYRTHDFEPILRNRRAAGKPVQPRSRRRQDFYTKLALAEDQLDRMIEHDAILASLGGSRTTRQAEASLRSRAVLERLVSEAVNDAARQFRAGALAYELGRDRRAGSPSGGTP